MGSLERRAKFGTIQSVAPDAGYRAHVLWSGAATAPDPERPLVAPSSSQFAKLLDLSVAVPAPVHRVPLLAGIRIYHDGFAGDPAQLPDEVDNEFGCGAINADPDDLRLTIE